MKSNFYLHVYNIAHCYATILRYLYMWNTHVYFIVNIILCVYSYIATYTDVHSKYLTHFIMHTNSNLLMY